MSLKEFKDKTPVELREREKELRTELFELRTQLATEKCRTPRSSGRSARTSPVQTLLRQQEIAARRNKAFRQEWI